MERRKFLQNIFGAAVIAAIPKPIFDSIVNTPLPIPSSSPAINGTKPIFTKTVDNGKWLFIYRDNEDQLLAQSNEFSLDVRQDFINVEMEDGGWFTKYPKPQEAIIQASKIYTYNKSLVNSMQESDPVKIVVVYENMKIVGNAYLTEMEWNVESGVILNAKLKVSGQLMISTE